MTDRADSFDQGHGMTRGSDVQSKPAASVIVRVVSDDPILFEQCIACIDRQVDVEFEIIVVDSSGDPRIADLCSRTPSMRRETLEDTGVSAGRNRGLEVARHRYVAFTDPDCLPGRRWLIELVRALDRGAAIVASRIVPKWLAKPPRLLENSTIARAQWSLLDLGDDVCETSRVIGSGFAVNRELTADQGFFRTELGYSPTSPIGGEETDLCRRVTRRGGTVLYTPHAVVEHQISPSRLTYRWMLRRTYFGGLSRAIAGGPPDPINRRLSLEDRCVLPLLALPYIAGLLRGRLAAIFRS
jgi:GT2 family glycosyltransferase